MNLNSRPRDFISSDEVLKANRARADAEAQRYASADSDSGTDLDDLVIDEYGHEIVLDKVTMRSLSPSMKSKIATGKYVHRKKGPKLT